ncbi:conjugal transfer protein TraH [Vibrio cyclitrophicus]
MSVHITSKSRWAVAGLTPSWGVFSHISADHLVQFGKAVVQNLAPFAVDLALQVWAPQVKQIRDNLQNIADKFLTQSMSCCGSCSSRSKWIGNASIGGSGSEKTRCETIGTQRQCV